MDFSITIQVKTKGVNTLIMHTNMMSLIIHVLFSFVLFCVFFFSNNKSSFINLSGAIDLKLFYVLTFVSVLKRFAFNPQTA